MFVAPRLALFYAAVFFLVGIQLPFWPVWLAGRGLSPSEIGLVLATALWLKVFSNPLAGLLADRSGKRRAVMIGLGAANLAGFLLFVPAYGFWSLLAINALTTATFSALMPLGDNLTLAIAQEQRLDYGRIRVWGSISFIAAALGAGAVLSSRPSEMVLAILIGAAGLNLLACAQLPPHEFGGARAPGHVWRALLIDRRQLLFLAAASAIQASHSVYYAFGTLHWKALGYSGETIGVLWSEGVIAEIVLFAFGAKLVAALGPSRLLVLAGVAGMVRWGFAAEAVALPALLVLQILHALTFGAAHLAAMHFLSRALPPALSATGQSLYSATVSGVGFGLVMAGTGTLYAAFGAQAYLAMAGLAALGALAGWGLGRVWRGERLTAS
jgi:PPP family 3-phenylpropionic acid transporter